MIHFDHTNDETKIEVQQCLSKQWQQANLNQSWMRKKTSSTNNMKMQSEKGKTLRLKWIVFFWENFRNNYQTILWLQ